MHAGLGGLFTGWGYLHSALYRYFCRDRACVGSASRGILYVQEVTYTLFVWAISAMGTLGFLLLTHWDTVWAATRIDEQALDALWATRKRFRLGRKAS